MSDAAASFVLMVKLKNNSSLVFLKLSYLSKTFVWNPVKPQENQSQLNWKWWAPFIQPWCRLQFRSLEKGFLNLFLKNLFFQSY